MVSGRSTIRSSRGPVSRTKSAPARERLRRERAAPAYTRDVSYLYAFQEVVPPIARAFRPDLICSQLGADAHYLDPLTHLMLTTETYEAVGRILDGLSSELCGGRWIAVGGGGYDVTAVPRVWTVLFATMVGLRLDDALPTNWLREGNRLVGTLPGRKAPRD